MITRAVFVLRGGWYFSGFWAVGLVVAAVLGFVKGVCLWVLV